MSSDIQDTILQEATAYLLGHLRAVTGPLQTIMYEAPDGKGGQFTDPKVALLCWLKRNVSQADTKEEE